MPRRRKSRRGGSKLLLKLGGGRRRPAGGGGRPGRDCQSSQWWGQTQCPETEVRLSVKLPAHALKARRCFASAFPASPFDRVRLVPQAGPPHTLSDSRAGAAGSQVPGVRLSPQSARGPTFLGGLIRHGGCKLPNLAGFRRRAASRCSSWHPQPPWAVPSLRSGSDATMTPPGAAPGRLSRP